MVCLGNICRSPLAEGLLHEKIKENNLNWEVDSAGTESFHTGEHPHHLSQKVAHEHGIDISSQRARRFTKADFQHFDKIYAMAPDVYQDISEIGGREAQMGKVDLLLNELSPGKNHSVPDPWYGGKADFNQAYELIEEACDAIIENYTAQPKIK